MFKFEELCELIRLVDSSEIASVEIEHAGGRLRIEGKLPVVVAAPVSQVPEFVTPAASTEAAGTSPSGLEAGAVSVDEDEGLVYVTSPIVGTFYRAPNPEAEPYVKVGDSVDSGRTLCIVEAMKLMNEIESDVTGTVVRVIPQNAQPVEFGERLFAIRAS
jgi:acetyl-CoA carboxylase biotin carboxyl carrier protein